MLILAQTYIPAAIISSTEYPVKVIFIVQTSCFNQGNNVLNSYMNSNEILICEIKPVIL